MASDESFVTFVCDQLAQVPQITCRKMFGEYALYVDEKVVAFVCDNSVGACLKECTTSVECSPGTLCNGATKQCAAAPTSDDGGGCSSSPGAPAGALFAVALLACAVAAQSRRSIV